MMQKWIQLLVQRSGVALVLVFAFIAPPLPLYAAAGQSVPPAECVDDRGNAVEPRAEISEAWLLMLNFNHAPSVAVTTGCLVVRKNGSQLGYQLIECQLNNNLKQTAVGGGAATFDGYLWIECGGLGFDTTTQETFDLA
ncbi:MAG TPA: hypothetical protein PKE45_12170, partial [Caldilineaceae bacterium]|nr:hypothetical protein [Caldilineaceae bacterium]